MVIESFESLGSAFRDEDPEVWIDAAIRLGKLGAPALPFIQEHLASSHNLHSHRHAWCALAAHLGSAGTPTDLRFTLVTGKKKDGSDNVEPVLIKDWLKGWLSNTVLLGLKDSTSTLAEVEHAVPRFKEIRRKAIERFRQQALTSRKEADSDHSPESQLSLWQSDLTPLNAVRLPAQSYPWDPWSFASFIAGATPTVFQDLDLSVEYFVKAMVALADRGGDRAAFIINLPRMLSTFGGPHEEDRAQLGRLTSLLIERLPDTQLKDIHLVQYLCSIQTLIQEQGLDLEWSVADSLFHSLDDSPLRDAVSKWKAAQPGDEEERATIAVARAAEACFCDRLRWRELLPNQRLSSAVFFLAVCTVRGGQSQWRIFTLRHRIDLVRENISRWKETNPELLTILVRMLKLLLNAELRMIGDGQAPVNTCRRHLSYVQPVLDLWHLPGTISKDLATVVARTLAKATTDAGDEHTVVSDGLFREIMYAVFYALPERAFLTNIWQYAQDEVVRDRLAKLSMLVTEVTSKDERRKHEPLSKQPYREIADLLWCDSSPDYVHLMSLLCRDTTGTHSALTPDTRQVLAWIVTIREKNRIEGTVGPVSEQDDIARQAIESEERLRVDEVVQECDSLLHQIASYEQAIEGGTDDPRDVIDSMRSLLGEIQKLKRFAGDSLPILESEVMLRALDAKSTTIEKRLILLSSIVNDEDESLAVNVTSGDRRHELTGRDHQVVANWMLSRHMLQELAPQPNWIIRCVLNWKWTLAWILTPFLLAALVYRVFLHSPLFWLCGVPFIAVPFVQCALLLLYCRNPAKLPGGISSASLLLPQMVGALFLGVHDAFGWSDKLAIGVLEAPVVRAINLAVFLAASYFFVRYVFLKGQHPGGERRGFTASSVLRRRAFSILSIGIWQSFGLISLFCVVKAGVLAVPRLGDLQNVDRDIVEGLSRALSGFLPNAIPVGREEWVRVLVFPWAILSMTIELFFVSAIFERILHRGAR